MPRGGARPGSGRKPMTKEAKKVQASIQLAPDLAAWLSGRAKETGTTRSALVTRLLEDFRAETTGPAAEGDWLNHLRSVTFPAGRIESRTLSLPVSSWLQLEGRSDRERKPIGLVAAELLALGMAAESLIRQEAQEA